jgi:hypothetical protein
MKQTDQFFEHARRAFPIEPIPRQFFGSDPEWPAIGDIADDLQTRVRGRPWSSISMNDWRMIGSPWSFRRYLEPSVYLYYVPSLVLEGISAPGVDQFALEAIVPHNKTWVPRGAWWQAFAEAVTEEQRTALSTILATLRIQCWDEIGPANQDLVAAAERIWAKA